MRRRGNEDDTTVCLWIGLACADSLVGTSGRDVNANQTSLAYLDDLIVHLSQSM